MTPWTKTTERPEVNRDSFVSDELLVRTKRGTYVVAYYNWRSDKYRSAIGDWEVDAKCWMVIPE